jgi:hypothetical protein
MTTTAYTKNSLIELLARQSRERNKLVEMYTDNILKVLLNSLILKKIDPSSSLYNNKISGILRQRVLDAILLDTLNNMPFTVGLGETDIIEIYEDIKKNAFFKKLSAAIIDMIQTLTKYALMVGQEYTLLETYLDHLKNTDSQSKYPSGEKWYTDVVTTSVLPIQLKVWELPKTEPPPRSRKILSQVRSSIAPYPMTPYNQDRPRRSVGRYKYLKEEEEKYKKENEVETALVNAVFGFKEDPFYNFENLFKQNCNFVMKKQEKNNHRYLYVWVTNTPPLMVDNSKVDSLNNMFDILKRLLREKSTGYEMEALQHFLNVWAERNNSGNDWASILLVEEMNESENKEETKDNKMSWSLSSVSSGIFNYPQDGTSEIGYVGNLLPVLEQVAQKGSYIRPKEIEMQKNLKKEQDSPGKFIGCSLLMALNFACLLQYEEIKTIWLQNAAKIAGCICYIRAGSAMGYQVWADEQKYNPKEKINEQTLVNVTFNNCETLNTMHASDEYAYAIYFSKKDVTIEKIRELVNILDR